MKIFSTRSDWPSFQARACSLPPEPTIRILNGADFEDAITAGCRLDWIGEREPELACLAVRREGGESVHLHLIGQLASKRALDRVTVNAQ